MKKLLLFTTLLAGVAIYNSAPRVLSGQSQTATATNAVNLEKPKEVRVLTLSIQPGEVMQGEPVLFVIDGLTSTSSIVSIRFNSQTLPPFEYEGRVAALAALDLRLTPGSYPVKVVLADGRVLEENVVVKERKIESAPLGIPETLGGNTPEAEKELINTLVEEGKIISAIKTSREKLWTGPFGYPVASPITITDVYGYSRQTGGSSIAHKGTDFRAKVGTPIVAINDGRVVYTGYLRNYGNVIGVDHGTGLLSIYMHLSSIGVTRGQEVRKGERIGLSGDTGYVLGPHLHLTIRINGISIDPLKFLEIL